MKSLNKLSSENILQEKHKFLEYIFSHPKCEVLSDDEKSKISDAYNLAEEAHREQLQKRGTPYISHIQGTILDYLNKVTSRTSVDAASICVTILHDVIEDHPEFSGKILEKFGLDIYTRVLALTKPSTDVLLNTFGTITGHVITSGIQNKPSDFYLYAIQKFTKSGQLIEGHKSLYAKIFRQWDASRALDQKYQKNWMFLWKIADLSEEDFEIKTADRINNLNNLSAVDMKYIDSNIASTGFYIAKARALGRDDLAGYLQEGIQKLQKRKTELERSITSK